MTPILAAGAPAQSEKSIERGAASSLTTDTDKAKGSPLTPQSASDGSPTSLRSPVTGVTPKSDVEQLRAQLGDARTEILTLKERLSDQGLRQRKVGGDLATEAAPTAQAQQAPEAGVPIQFVASLCLLSFLLAYFFF